MTAREYEQLDKMSHNDGSGINAAGHNVQLWRLGDINIRQNSTSVPKRVDCAHKGTFFMKTDFTTRRSDSNEGSVGGVRISKKNLLIFE